MPGRLPTAKPSGRQCGDFCGVKGKRGERALINGDVMLEARFFPDAELNFGGEPVVEKRRGRCAGLLGEDKVRDRWSSDRLSATVSRLQQAYRALGIGKGDRVAAMMPNMPETIACMLAAASIGSIWSSCSPDFGEQGVLDRFGQIEPKLFYCPQRLLVWRQTAGCKVQRSAPSRSASVAPCGHRAVCSATPMRSQRRRLNAKTLAAFIAPFEAKAVEFVRLPFSHPLFILFSSGTTGVPKCIVHPTGGALCAAHQGAYACIVASFPAKKSSISPPAAG